MNTKLSNFFIPNKGKSTEEEEASIRRTILAPSNIKYEARDNLTETRKDT